MSELASLDAVYGHRFGEESSERQAWRRAVWQVLVDDFFSRWIPSDATVLDFGCGMGEFINAVRCARRFGVDARPSVTRHLAAGVEFRQAEGVRLPQLASRSVDVVFCSNLLEHLPDRAAVRALFEEFHRLLSARGRLLLLGPNLRYTGPAYWDFFDHVLPITHHSLVEALAGAGFAVQTLLPRFLPYTTVGARLTPPALVRLYLRAPPLWRLFGAQFFAVATLRPELRDA